jgi:HTH-type transcriptional regulator, competence development regulator
MQAARPANSTFAIHASQPESQNCKRAIFLQEKLELSNRLLYLSINDKSNYSSQMKETFGEYVKKLRKEHELTLTQLAAQLDLDSANLSKIENGIREFDGKRLNKLANVFQLDLDKLKTEFYSDFIAKKLYETNCNNETLILAEKKIEYLKQRNSTQAKIKFKNG